MTEPDQPRPLTLVEAVIPVASLILLVGLSYYLFGEAGASGPNQVALVVATMVAVQQFFNPANDTITSSGTDQQRHVMLNLPNTVKLLADASTGLAVSSTKADVVNTDVVSNTTGISTTGTGVDVNAFPMTGPTQVRIAWGNAIGNTTAYVMNDPGTGGGGNKITILQFLTSNTTAAFSTNMAGNGTLVSGTGPSCGGTNCQNLGFYSSNTNPH